MIKICGFTFQGAVFEVRYNNTCGALALGLALDHASREWLRWRDDHSLIHGEDAWAERRYSFLNGTCYCKTVQ